MDNSSKVISSSCNSSEAAKCCNNENTEEATLFQYLQKGILEATNEHVVYTKEITNLLSELNLHVKTLPNDIKENLEKVSTMLRAEGLFEFDEAALSVIKERKIVEKKRQQREVRQMLLMHDVLIRNCANLQTKLDYLQSELDSAQKAFDATEKEKDELYNNKVLLSTKLNEYQQTAEKLQTNLSAMQVDKLYPEKILNKYKLYLEKKVELTDLERSLAQYHDLPPNLLQAKQLLESKRKEYETLENCL